jgi:hypothetical protein
VGVIFLSKKGLIKMSKLCGTCKWVSYKDNKGNGEVARDGYCYGNTPFLGGMRPMVKLGDKACRLYESNKNKED